MGKVTYLPKLNSDPNDHKSKKLKCTINNFDKNSQKLELLVLTWKKAENFQFWKIDRFII